jgi:hypothetical protein
MLILKNIPVTLFRKLVPRLSDYPLSTLKVVSKAACDPKIVLTTGCDM